MAIPLSPRRVAGTASHTSSATRNRSTACKTSSKLNPSFSVGQNQPACISCHGGGASNLRHGYATFAETFSGWRGAPQNSAALSDKAATRAGIAAVYEANSPYGVYWVMIVG